MFSSGPCFPYPISVLTRIAHCAIICFIVYLIMILTALMQHDAIGPLIMSYLSYADARLAAPTCRAAAASAITASNARAVAWAILSYLDGRTSVFDTGSAWCTRCTTMLLVPPKIMLPRAWRNVPAAQITPETVIPAHVETLVLYCQPLHRLPNLAGSRLHELRTLQCYQLTELPERLPAQLVKLVVATCLGITALPELPRHIVEVKLIGCPNVKTLPALHRLPSMKLLSVLSSSALASLPELPEGVETLRLHNCPALTKLPARLPERLSLCHITQCPRLKELPTLPDDLQDLSIAWSSGIAALPEQLPARLRRLSAASCPRIAKLPCLPASLELLNVSWCLQLKEEPAGLQRIASCETVGSGFARAKLSGMKRRSEVPLSWTSSLSLDPAAAGSTRLMGSRQLQARG